MLVWSGRKDDGSLMSPASDEKARRVLHRHYHVGAWSARLEPGMVYSVDALASDRAGRALLAWEYKGEHHARWIEPRP